MLRTDIKLGTQEKASLPNYASNQEASKRGRKNGKRLLIALGIIGLSTWTIKKYIEHQELESKVSSKISYL